LAWLGLAWLGLAWLGLVWSGLAWPGLAWPGLDILPAYTAIEDGTECSETSAHKIQTPGNRPKKECNRAFIYNETSRILYYSY